MFVNILCYFSPPSLVGAFNPSMWKYVTRLKLSDRFVGAQRFFLCFSLPAELLLCLMLLFFTKFNPHMLTIVDGLF